MKHLTGQFISEVGSILYEATKNEFTPEILKERLNAAINTFFALSMPIVNDATTAHLERETLRNASPDELQRLSSLLPWSTYSALGKVALGNTYNQTKRSNEAAIPDNTVSQLAHIYPLSGTTIIESGCFEGIHSVSMALLGAKVYAFDARIENVIKSLVRAWAYGIEGSIQFDLINLELPHALSIYKRVKNLDLYHCRGVLYHLKDPVRYLQDIAQIAPRAIYIHSQVASNGQADDVYTTDIGAFRVFKYTEGPRQSPFAGINPYALWLEPEGIKRILADYGYTTTLIEHIWQERNGDRLELLVTR